MDLLGRMTRLTGPEILMQTAAFCSMVALLFNGRPIQSWIWQPLGRRLFLRPLTGGLLILMMPVNGLLLQGTAH